MAATAQALPGSRSTAPHLSSTIVTMQLGVALAVLLALLFLSGGMFYLYVFNYDIGPFFPITRFIHFYVGLASIPFLLAKYGSTTFRFLGYYLGVTRFKKAGPPALIPRIFSPLLALDFFVLYFSGLYMLFHVYYRVTNISPLELKPVQLHLWAALLAVPLLAIHLGAHLLETASGLSAERQRLRVAERAGERPAERLTRRAFVGTVALGGVGLALAYQNTPLVNATPGGLFIGRIPAEERGGPGDFPVETLFGKVEIDQAAWRLKVDGAVGRELSLTYDEVLALPAVEHTIRIACVSGWTNVVTWRGPRVRDLLALAGANPDAQSVGFGSASGYGFVWHRDRLRGDRALLATHVNGAPLSLNHGFPIRLIVPGYPGQNMVKQIERIEVRNGTEPFNPDFKLVSAQLEGTGA